MKSVICRNKHRTLINAVFLKILLIIFFNANLKEVDYLNSVYELLFASFPHRSFIFKKKYIPLYIIFTLYTRCIIIITCIIFP